MRVITGKAKGRRLQSVPGNGTRPITDRAKSALFSILHDWIEGSRVLDLFGGTGAVGIEFLSRGAAAAHFLDLNRKAVETIWANLRLCRLDALATVQQGDSFLFLERYTGEPFDFIYIAPPQYQGLWHKALGMVDQRPSLLAENGSVIVQIHPKEETPIELTHLAEYDRRRYGSVMLLFYANAADLAAEEDDLSTDEQDAPEDWDDEPEDAEEDELAANGR
jgi:16S rRNA (guanine966-N2)-methyltransferase